MGRIQVLPETVINQIAAGEVVERPASVVKELVENAIDAGARQITVTVQNGGKDLISVLDDGSGMDEADARLACQRHATSKIARPEDLEAITSLGFRGEALASIASVSRFELVTCADETQGGWRIALEGGQERECGRQGFPRGTRVSVRELFFNQPARRKFLKATATELGHIQAVLTQAALARPELGLRLVHNERQLMSLPAAASLSERAFALFGRELEAGLLPVEGAEGGLEFGGLVSLPGQAPGSRRWQFLFLNGRPVRHAGLNHAVYHAYRTLLMKDRHPAYVLKLKLDPREVDVNVHPAKTEVRLRNGQWVHTVLADRLYRAILEGSRRAVFGREAAGVAFGREKQSGVFGREAAGAAFGREKPAAASGREGGGARFGQERAAGRAAPGGAQLVLAAGAGEVREAALRILDGTAERSAAEASPGGSAPAAVEASAESRLEAHALAGGSFHFQPVTGPLPGEAPWAGPHAESAPLPGGLGRDWQVLGQLARTYILAQRGQGLIVIDQHAAHERILFERYRAQFSRGRPAGEPFLVPETLELSPQNALLLEQYLPEWRRMGFDIESFGARGYLVRQVPALLKGRDVKALVLEVLDELALFGKSGRIEEVLNEILERVACHAAVRAGDELGLEEMDQLIAELSGLDINLYCPHGRPVWIELDRHELERRFKRTV